MLINVVTIAMYLVTAISFLALLQSSSFGASVYEIDDVLFLITMSLVAVLFNWYNKGRYNTQAKRSIDYNRLLLLQFCISAAGAAEALLLMRNQHETVVFLLTIIVRMLNILIMYSFACFTRNYIRAPLKIRTFYMYFNRTAAVICLTVDLLNYLTAPYSDSINTIFSVLSGNPFVTPLINAVWIVFVGYFASRYVKEKAIARSLISFLAAVFPCLAVYYVSGAGGDAIWMPSLRSFFRYLALLAIFCNVYVERSRMILNQQNLLQERETELIRNRLDNLLLQINPHFLYNTLGSIKSLCILDPEKAAELVQQFAEYLQSNYSDMANQQMVPFRKELEYVKQYLRIEQVRFPNLKVEYDIKAKDFMIPSLSIQPLAENAVRHGIGQKRRNAGTLWISSREYADRYEVCIEDDGAGFDPKEEKKDDGRKHIGIANVRTRLELVCGGSLQIESSPGIGTKCMICLYKEEKDSIEETA